MLHYSGEKRCNLQEIWGKIIDTLHKRLKSGAALREERDLSHCGNRVEEIDTTLCEDPILTKKRHFVKTRSVIACANPPKYKQIQNAGCFGSGVTGYARFIPHTHVFVGAQHAAPF